MTYEQALHHIGFLKPATKKAVIETGKRAEEALHCISLRTMNVDKKHFHAYRYIAEEGRLAQQDDYELPDLAEFKPTIKTVDVLQQRFSLALEKYKHFAEDHFGLDPEKLTQFEIDRLVDLLHRLEKINR
jgi:hypothetical protein